MSNGDISSTFFRVWQEGTSLRLPYFSNHPIDNANDSIELVVFAFHGSGDPIAAEYLDRVQDAASMIPGATNTTLIIAPQLAQFDHLENFYGAGNSPGDIMYGGSSRFWGGLSGNSSVRISYFTAIDQLLSHICCSGNFTNLRRVVFVGHSGGGQFVNRYAGCSPIQCVGLSFRYIAMNPSSYMYLNDERWVSGTSHNFAVPSTAARDSITACSNNHIDFNNYNNYGYGLDNLNWGYHRTNQILEEAVISRYRVRDIVHLVGENDNDPSGDGLDRKCQAMLQGEHRRERGELYSEYLKYFFGSLPNHHFEVIAGAGHSGRQMINSNRGRHFIFEEFNFPVMKTLADYQLIRDTAIELSSGENHAFEFVLPDDAVSSGHSKRPILAFFADPSGNANNLRLVATMNGAEVFNYRYSGGVGRGHWEAFTHDHLRIGATNTLQLSVASGTGRMNVSDIVIWYQRSVC
jgi:hypothetical protein